MKRGLFIALAALVVTMAGSVGYYRAAVAPARDLLRQSGGELERLRQEFRLDEAQFAEVRRVHEEYAPRCEAMCARIAAATEKAATLIRGNTTVTWEVAAAMQERATVEEECRRAMLEHIYEIAGAMKPEQGRRYVEMMKGRVLASDRSSSQGATFHHGHAN